MFKKALSALELLLNRECIQVSHRVAQEAYERIKATPIEQKRNVFWDCFFPSWTAGLSDFIEKAFQEYVQLGVANDGLIGEEPLQWAETNLRQLLELRLGHEMKIAHPDPSGTSEMSFAERVTGGQKAYNWITYWIAEACSGEGQNLGDWLGEGEWELDDEAVDSWQAPAWLITSPSQKDQPLEGWLDAKTTAPEVGLIHFELWRKLEEAIERARLCAEVDIAASTDPAVEVELLTEQTIKADATKKDFYPQKYGGTELCIAVSYHKAGFRDLRRLALGMKNVAHIKYPGQTYLDPMSWYREDPKGFTQHLWKLREKAKRNNWYDSIPSEYYQIYAR